MMREKEKREEAGCIPGSRTDSPDLHIVTSGEVIETPFSALRTSSSARLLFSPVSF
jgi:hypothetical protein